MFTTLFGSFVSFHFVMAQNRLSNVTVEQVKGGSSLVCEITYRIFGFWFSSLLLILNDEKTFWNCLTLQVAIGVENLLNLFRPKDPVLNRTT